MSVKVLTEYHLEFLTLNGGCTGSSESTLVKMPHCWKSHVTAHIFNNVFFLSELGIFELQCVCMFHVSSIKAAYIEDLA